MVNPHRLGLVVGIFSGAVHFVWSILVALGVAQRLFTTMLALHFINLNFGILPFDIKYAVGLIIVTLVTGYVTGWVLAYIWNYVQSKK